MQKRKSSLSEFSWPRGQADLWLISRDQRNRRPPLICYSKDVLDEGDGSYRPLQDEPRLFEEFAALGAAAFEVGLRCAPEAIERERLRLDGKKGPLTGFDYTQLLPPDPYLPELVVTYAQWDRSMTRKALHFVRAYGSPWEVNDSDLPHRYHTKYRAGIEVGDILALAWDLQRALVLAKEVQDLEEAGWENVEVGDKKQKLAGEVNIHLNVELFLEPSEVRARFAPGFACIDLLSAMWLQLFEALTGGKTWRICKGCPRLFNQIDPRQKYHDVACRNRAHFRLYGRKKGG